MVIVPTMQISWTLFSILSGGVFFEEYLAFTQLSTAMFVLGVVVSPVNACSDILKQAVSHSICLEVCNQVSL